MLQNINLDPNLKVILNSFPEQYFFTKEFPNFWLVLRYHPSSCQSPWRHFQEVFPINVGRCYLECFDGADAILMSLVVVAGERTFEHGAGVNEVVGLLDSNVAPV